MIQIQKTMSAVAEESLCDHSESGTGEGTVTGKTKTSSLENGDVNRDFIKVEELNVRRARLFVIVGFVFCACTVAVSVLIFAVRSDKEAFKVEVRKNATTTFRSLRNEMKHMATNAQYHCTAFLPTNHSTMDSLRKSWTS
jgi:hypothetical protein